MRNKLLNLLANYSKYNFKIYVTCFQEVYKLRDWNKKYKTQYESPKYDSQHPAHARKKRELVYNEMDKCWGSEGVLG